MGVTWGIVATVKAPAGEILRFVAHHLELGAHRVFIYLDEETPEALEALKAHPKARVFNCDAAYWEKRKRDRPDKHQSRQTANATHAYNRADVDWIAHVDVDEFIWPDAPLAERLAGLPDACPTARMRPVESLACAPDLYKAFVPAGSERDDTVRAIYPQYGAFVKGGFMSHVAGKLFARTGRKKASFRIHNLFHAGQMVEGGTELDNVELLHRHAKDWGRWLAAYRYRVTRGSYRPGMAPNVPVAHGGLSMHELLTGIEAEYGEAGLRAFYDEMNAVDPVVRQNLEERNMVLFRPLHLDEKLARHFPDFV
ncbi:glycosyltransferase family 2 protein [Lutimaribacter marinistellae]|uniref:Glycosyltransferase family 2 protein n=1 Tax=Lutimaribacter marinistellae TaxID=1820329 RepID=A0ABV7TKV8_9RHOB